MKFAPLVLLAFALVVPGVNGQTIADIQGAGHISPYRRENVAGVTGIVTAVAPGSDFYMQSPEPDGDPATSDGIHVEGYRLPRIAVGDLVRVSGRVDEKFPGGPSSGNLPITKILRAQVEVVSHDNPLPEPVVLGRGGRMPPTEVITDDADGLVYDSQFDPDNDALDFYETLEGMLVQINDAVSVGTIHTAYGEIWVLPDNGAWASVRTPRGGIVVREGDLNPERILIDYNELPAIYTQDPVRLPVVGDRFTGPVVGVVSYSYGNYKVRPVGQLPTLSVRGLPRESAKPVTDPEILSVASFNVYNLAPTDPPAKFADIAGTIVTGLAAPDIVVLEEVQDNDGERRSDVVAADGTARLLTDAIAEAGGPVDYRYLEIAPQRERDGGAPGGNIRVGMLYRSTRVELAGRPGGNATTAAAVALSGGDVLLTPNPARIDPENRAFSSSRKPLAAEFTFRERTLFVIGNHFNSKGGDGYVFGQVQPPTFNSENQRTMQAEVVRGFVEEILAADPDAYVVVAGDLNDFAFSRPVRTLGAGENLINLGATLLEPGDVYSYIYEGNSQALDHILVSAALFAQGAPTVRYVHRYCEYLYEDRYGDHDPILARFKLE